MAITARPYVAFLAGLGMGYHSFNNDHYWCGLLSSYYLPQYETDQNWFDVNWTEIGDGRDFPDPGDDPYLPNGQRVSSLNWAYDATKQAQILTGDNCIWGTPNGVFRYAVVYRWSGVTGDTDSKLVGCIDYGSDQQLDPATPLTIDFSSGIVSLAAA